MTREAEVTSRVWGFFFSVVWIILLAHTAASEATPASAQQVEASDEAREIGTHVFGLDRITKQLIEVDVATKKITRSLQLTGTNPVGFAKTPVGTRLLVLHEYPTKVLVFNWLLNKGRPTLSIVDTATFSLIGQVELGWGWPGAHLERANIKKYQMLEFDSVAFTPDSDLMCVVCPGAPTHKKLKEHAAELVVVDVRSGKRVARTDLGRPYGELLVAETCAVVYFRSDASEDRPGTIRPTELVYVNTTTGTIEKRLDLPSNPLKRAVSPDLRHAYFLIKTPENAEKTEVKKDSKSVLVVSMKEPTIEATLEASPESDFFLTDDVMQQTLLFGDAEVAEGRPPVGEIRVIRGAELTAVLSIARHPAIVRRSPGNSDLLVIGTDELSLVDAGAPSVRTTFSLAQTTTGSSGGGQLDGPIIDGVLTQDSNRAIVVVGKGGEAATVDLEDGSVLQIVKTGRTGMKVANALVEGFVELGQGFLAQHHNTMLGMTLDSVQDVVWNTGALITLHPNGTRAYVYNANTTDLTIIDVATGALVDKAAFHSRSDCWLGLAPGTTTLIGGQSPNLNLFDLDTNKQTRINVAHATGVLMDTTVSKDGRFVAVACLKHAAFIDVASSEIIGELGGMKGLRWVAFANPDGRAKESR